MKILWLDDDLGTITSFVQSLSEIGWEIDVCRSPVDAERMLENSARQPYELLILDVMIPTTLEEEAAYPLYATNAGIETGLVFLQRTKHLLLALNTAVLVLTGRLDQDIRHRFAREAIPNLHFGTKFSLRSPAELQAAAAKAAASRNGQSEPTVRIEAINVIAAQKIVGSQFTQTSPHGTIGSEPRELTAFLHDACATALKLLSEARLDPIANDEAEEAIESLRNEVQKEKPDARRAAAALSSLKRVLEGAAGGALGGELLKRFIEVLGG
jgi:CheY-like chemotaxis protein